MHKDKDLYKGNEDFFAGMNEDAVQQRINSERRFFMGLIRRLENKPKPWVIFAGILSVCGFIFTDILLLWLFFVVGEDRGFAPLAFWAFLTFFNSAIGFRIGLAVVRGCKGKNNVKEKITILRVVYWVAGTILFLLLFFIAFSLFISLFS